MAVDQEVSRGLGRTRAAPTLQPAGPVGGSGIGPASEAFRQEPVELAGTTLKTIVQPGDLAAVAYAITAKAREFAGSSKSIYDDPS